MTERKVKNRFHFFVKREFTALNPNASWMVEINVPFEADELILRDVANSDAMFDSVEISDGASTAVVNIPNAYVCTFALDSVGTLCTFTNNCYTKLDNVFKLSGAPVSGMQTFRIATADGLTPTGGTHIASSFTAHLEFILYEK